MHHGKKSKSKARIFMNITLEHRSAFVKLCNNQYCIQMRTNDLRIAQADFYSIDRTKSFILTFHHSPIARSAICGESLVCISRKASIWRPNMLQCYRMHSSQSVQRMQHLQDHWFWKERIEPLGITSIHIIFRSRLSSKWEWWANNISLLTFKIQ